MASKKEQRAVKVLNRIPPLMRKYNAAVEDGKKEQVDIDFLPKFQAMMKAVLKNIDVGSISSKLNVDKMSDTLHDTDPNTTAAIIIHLRDIYRETRLDGQDREPWLTQEKPKGSKGRSKGRSKGKSKGSNGDKVLNKLSNRYVKRDGYLGRVILANRVG